MMRSLVALPIMLLLAGCTTTHPPTRSGSAVAKEQTPTERYEAYRVALERAEAMEEVLPLTSKAVRVEMSKRPPTYRKALLGDMQIRKVEWMRVLEERVFGDTASLSVEGVQVVDPMRGVRGFGKGRVVLLREEGAWRVDDETWTLEGDDTSGLTPRDWATKPKK
jgi:hypothetical protein